MERPPMSKDKKAAIADALSTAWRLGQYSLKCGDDLREQSRFLDLRIKLEADLAAKLGLENES
jgi:hypothetical protein